MKEIICEGKEIAIKGIGIKWLPFASIHVISEKESCECEVLIDSGADITLFPRKIGEFLGFDFKEDEIKEMHGIGYSAIPYVIKSVMLKIGEIKFNCRVGISLIEEVPMILGRLDVFDRFDIEFRQSKRITIFKPV